MSIQFCVVIAYIGCLMFGIHANQVIYDMRPSRGICRQTYEDQLRCSFLSSGLYKPLTMLKGYKRVIFDRMFLSSMDLNNFADLQIIEIGETDLTCDDFDVQTTILNGVQCTKTVDKNVTPPPDVTHVTTGAKKQTLKVTVWHDLEYTTETPAKTGTEPPSPRNVIIALCFGTIIVISIIIIIIVIKRRKRITMQRDVTGNVLFQIPSTNDTVSEESIELFSPEAKKQD